METTFIYALCEPGTRTIRYIGKANNLKARLRQHLQRSINLDSPLGEWLRRLSGAVPSILVLCETSKAFWQDDETRFIRSARMLGMDLVNATDGGEGVTQTPEVRAKLSASWTNNDGSRRAGRPMSSITRVKISAALQGKKAWNKGKELSEEHKARVSAAHIGVALSVAHRAALSKAKLGKKLSLEHVALRSAAQTGKKRSPESCARMSEAAKTRWAKEKI